MEEEAEAESRVEVVESGPAGGRPQRRVAEDNLGQGVERQQTVVVAKVPEAAGMGPGAGTASASSILWLPHNCAVFLQGPEEVAVEEALAGTAGEAAAGRRRACTSAEGATWPAHRGHTAPEEVAGEASED